MSVASDFDDTVRAYFDRARIPRGRKPMTDFDQLTQVVQAADADRPVHDDVLVRHRRPEQWAPEQGVEHWRRWERSDTQNSPPQVKTGCARAHDALADEPANDFTFFLIFLEPDVDGLRHQRGQMGPRPAAEASQRRTSTLAAFARSRLTRRRRARFALDPGVDQSEAISVASAATIGSLHCSRATSCAVGGGKAW